MKIAIIGYGKMGHIIEQMARERGHEVVSIIDVANPEAFDSEAFAGADVAIEFSTPTAAWENIQRAWARNIPVVCGTTGWNIPLSSIELEEKFAAGATLLCSPNFSIGVNVTRLATRLISRLLNPYPRYTATIDEVHHIHKKDHPSGTAIMLADTIIENSDKYNAWIEPTTESRSPNAVYITARREGEVPGTHTVRWDSPEDTITLQHEAHGRQGFAAGAIAAAEWLTKAPRGARYTMDDVMEEMLQTPDSK